MSTFSTEQIEFNGMPAIRLRGRGAEATVMLHGGHVVSWIPANGGERLYLSDKAVFAPDQAIRGGVPVVFPQFGERGSLPKHGFARTQPWSLIDARGGDDYALAVLRLSDTPQTRAIWPHAFTLELSVCIGADRLDLELEVENDDDKSLTFATALHTYLRVREVEESAVEGLRGLRYTNARSGESRVDSGVSLTIEDETDRIYHDTAGPLLLRENGRSVGIHSENMPDTVIWNPWEHTCARIPDMPALGFRRMLCVEAAVIDHPVTLRPDESWWGRQTLLAM